MQTDWCWQLLELSPEADERTIKRQYAKLLKINRPDEDPVAFQQLREAYEQALQRVREERMPDSGIVIASNGFNPTTTRPMVLSSQEQALHLLAGLDDDSVESTWLEAKAKGLERVLEPLLFRRCLESASIYPNLLRWGLEQRQWLTPWQEFTSPEHEQQRLLSLLSTTLHARLEHYLALGAHEDFLECLARAHRQGWLGELSRQQLLQVQVLTLLIEHEHWPPAMLKSVCQIFAWDAPGAMPPIPEEDWHALQRRCEQRTWLASLQLLADQREQAPSPQANAAALFLLMQQPQAQKQLVAAFDEADWQACEQLSEAFAKRFADLLGMFPMHDPWFWKRLVEPRLVPHGVKRTTAILTLALVLQSLPGNGMAVMLIMLPLYVLGGFLGAKVGQWLLGTWYVASSLQELDERVSAWCVRKHIIPDRRYQVLRYLGPWLGLGLVIWSWLGILGAATYVLTGLIGVLQPAGMAPQHRQYRWRRPLQAIYRIAGLSWLQWVFCAAMIGVIGYLRLKGMYS